MSYRIRIHLHKPRKYLLANAETGKSRLPRLGVEILLELLELIVIDLTKLRTILGFSYVRIEQAR